jgi:hypothetical protein
MAMRRHWQLLKMAFRAMAWRATSGPPAIGLRGLAAWLAVEIVFLIGIGYSADSRFSEYGFGLTIGETLLAIAVSALVLRPEHRVAACAALIVMSMAITSVYTALLAGSSVLLGIMDTSPSVRWAASMAAFVLYLLWLTGAYAAAMRGIHPASRRQGWGRAGAVLAVQLLVAVTFPTFPAFSARDGYDNPPNFWGYARSLMPERKREMAEEPRRVDRAHVELAQPALMDEAIARLAPQTHGETDVYAIGIAGWAEQDVFIKELDGALAAIGKVLPVRDRTLRLVNHVDTVEKTPVAQRANFAAAVRAVARKMDRDEDVLLLFMTSHGSPDGVALLLPGLFSVDLAPQDVADVLDREGIKNRIVVVSACYSGVFVKPLANDNTIVVTAADEKSSSFGCSNEREWTYFGDAFFNRNLRADVSIEEAFLDAKATIGQWEARDGLTSSNPQGHFGPALMKRLARVYGGARTADRARSATP